MGVCDKQGCDHIIVFGRHARQSFTASALGPKIAQRCAFDVTSLGYRHHHVSAFDKVFVIHIAGPFDNLSAARYRKLVAYFGQLSCNNCHNTFT